MAAHLPRGRHWAAIHLSGQCIGRRRSRIVRRHNTVRHDDPLSGTVSASAAFTVVPKAL